VNDALGKGPQNQQKGTFAFLYLTSLILNHFWQSWYHFKEQKILY